jgi:hypothetical protein
MRNIKKYIFMTIIWFFFLLTSSHAFDVTRAGTSNVEPLESAFDPFSFELVTKKDNKDMLSEKTTQDIEIQKLKKELSNKDKIISEQKNWIRTLMEENVDLQTKYRYYMKVDKKNQDGFGEKYKMSKNDNFDDLKGSQPGKSLTSNQKTTMDNLYHQLTEVFQEEIEKGHVSIKFYKSNIK